MSDTKKTKSNAEKKTPSFVAYQVRDREGQTGFFTRIGNAWAHADGNGYTVQVESVPLDGRVVLRTPSAKKR